MERNKKKECIVINQLQCTDVTFFKPWTHGASLKKNHRVKISMESDNQFDDSSYCLNLPSSAKCHSELLLLLVISPLLFSEGNYFNQQIFETVSTY